MFNQEKQEQAYKFEAAYIQAERNHAANKLMDDIFGVKVNKISRKEAKELYLYKRLDGQTRLA